MQLTNLIVLCVLAITLIFVSCTLEKRVYRSGYHVAWNIPQSHRHAAKDEHAAKPSQQVSKRPFQRVPDSMEVSRNVTEDNFTTPINKAPANFNRPEDHAITNNKSFLLQDRTEHVSASEFLKKTHLFDETSDDNQKQSVLAFMGLIFTLTALSLLILGFVLGGAELIFLALIYYLPALLGVIFSLIGLLTIKDKKGKGAAIAGLVLGIILILLWGIVNVIAHILVAAL